ncbi:MAG: hypothetical protein IPK32_25460 [Verrucomicrobiaceae bacterium]|nr:hypothetical protein [Verrucomicrobiaceae bacterium]
MARLAGASESTTTKQWAPGHQIISATTEPAIGFDIDTLKHVVLRIYGADIDDYCLDPDFKQERREGICRTFSELPDVANTRSWTLSLFSDSTDA